MCAKGSPSVKENACFWVTAEVRCASDSPFRKNIWDTLKGAGTSAHLADLPEFKNKAKVVQVSPVVDPSSGTIEILAEVIGAHEELRPGMTVVVHVASRR